MKKLLALAELDAAVIRRVRPVTCAHGARPVTAAPYAGFGATTPATGWSCTNRIAMATVTKSVDFHDRWPLASTP